MRALSRAIRRSACFGLALLAVVSFVGPAVAQQRPAPVLELAAGTLFFADDGVVTEGLLGGAGRIYLSPRISVGPEIGVILGENHSHLMLTGNLWFDILAPENAQPRVVTPFLIVGGGLFRTREQFFNGPYAHNEGAFTAGGGLRARIGQRVTAGIEARVGWELHVRLNALIGVSLR